MNKKLLAVAVAGALALPGVALAQSSVTISGLMSLSFGNLKVQNFSAARAAGANASENRITDNSSRIVFNVVEDLGGGLQAIGQIDWRVALDNASDNPSGVSPNNGGGAGGNSHVGLRSNSWGRIIWGRQDLHYFNTSSDVNSGGRGDLKINPFTLLGVTIAGAVANLSRTPNVVHYVTPNWGGFTAIVAYSTNPTGPAGVFGNASSANEGDIGVAGRKGSAWNIQPVLQGSNYQVGYSYWKAKPDCGPSGGCATVLDQRSDKLFGYYAWGGLKVGLSWDKSKLQNAATAVRVADRKAWSVPVSYTFGPHVVEGHYTKAENDRTTAASDGAKMFALQYTYNLSKRTSASVTYSKITNDAGAAYNFFAATSAQIGHASAGVLAGEDPRLMSMSIRHAF